MVGTNMTYEENLIFIHLLLYFHIKILYINREKDFEEVSEVGCYESLTIRFSQRQYTSNGG